MKRLTGLILATACIATAATATSHKTRDRYEPQIDAPAAQQGAMRPSNNRDSRLGAYAGLSMGYGEGAGTSSDTGILFQLNGGFQFSPSLGAELGFTRFPNKTSRASKEKGNTYVWHAAGTLTTNLQPRWSFLGKVGVAIVDNTIAVNADNGSKGAQFGALLGAGVIYHLMPQWDVTAQGIATIGSSSAANTAGILFGANYRFQR